VNPTALLEARLGELAEGSEFITRGRTITESDLTSFSALTGDWHPQHSDAEWAARSRFSGRVAHGMLVLSYAIGLMPFDPERITIRVGCRVEARRPLDGEHALVTLALRVVNQEGQAVALAHVQAVSREAGVQLAPQLKAGDGGDTGRRSPETARAPGAPAEHLWRLYGGELFL
jgi:acyl dehydratase